MTLAEIKAKVDELIAAGAARDDAFSNFAQKVAAEKLAAAEAEAAEALYNQAAGAQHVLEDELEAMVIEFEPPPIDAP